MEITNAVYAQITEYNIADLLKKIERLQTLVNDSERSNLERQGKIEQLQKDLAGAKEDAKRLAADKHKVYAEASKAKSDRDETFLLVRQYKAMYDALFDKVYGTGEDE